MKCKGWYIPWICGYCRKRSRCIGKEIRRRDEAVFKPVRTFQRQGRR